MQLLKAIPGNTHYRRFFEPLLSDTEVRDMAIRDAEVDWDTTHIWYLLVNEEDQVMGFCSKWTPARMAHCRWSNNFMFPAWRNLGLFPILFAFRAAECYGQTVETFVYGPLVDIHIRHGFHVVRAGRKMVEPFETSWYEMHRP